MIVFSVLHLVGFVFRFGGCLRGLGYRLVCFELSVGGVVVGVCFRLLVWGG